MTTAESPAAATEGQAHAPEPGVTPHGHPSDWEYIKVALVLGVVTGIEVGIYYVSSIKDALPPILIGLSVIKFSLVVLWFMHLRFDSRIFRRLFVTGLVLAISVYVIVLSTLHVFSR